MKRGDVFRPPPVTLLVDDSYIGDRQPQIGSDRQAKRIIGVDHEFDHTHLNGSGRLDHAMKPESAQARNGYPRIGRRISAYLRVSGYCQSHKQRAVVTEGDGTITDRGGGIRGDGSGSYEIGRASCRERVLRLV